jgi:hypothetical protein
MHAPRPCRRRPSRAASRPAQGDGKRAALCPNLTVLAARLRARAMPTPLPKPSRGASSRHALSRWWDGFRLDGAPASSPDGAKRNPGTISKLQCQSRITLRFIRATKIKEAERRQTRSQPPCPTGHGAREASRARLSAFHHGTCSSDRTPPLSSSYALPGMGLVRNGCYPFPAIHSAAGYPADRLSCRPGVSTRSRPGAEVTSPPPAGTALAPPAGVAGWRPLRERDGG